MISITDEKIIEAEKILLPKGMSFTEEKKQIIRSLESKDIVACPGSGKTTTLLAKLSIIENHLPLNNNRGVCVLTHTNVAIDEVKARLGVASNKLFEYPNFFGTIQSFINYYLAIPFFRNEYGKNVSSIDDDVYNQNIIKEYFNLDRNIRFGLESNYRGEENAIEKIQSMRFSFETDELVDRTTNKPLFKTKNKTSIALLDLKMSLMQKGILCYEDAYWLAHKYLKKCGDLLSNFMSERFAFLFIDEMQDTSEFQINILESLLKEDIVTVQRFGDPNQSIYDNSDEMAWAIREAPLKITDSKRNSLLISNLIAPFELVPSGMKGNDEHCDIAPKIIVYEEGSINEVIPTFGKIICELNLHRNSRNIFKAVGRIGKDNGDGRIKLPSYFPEYNQKHQTSHRRTYLADFLSQKNISEHEQYDVKAYKDVILEAILRMLWLLNIKKEEASYFSKKTLIEEIQLHRSLYERFEEKLIKWVLKIRVDEEVKTDFIPFVEELLNEVFNVKDTTSLRGFYDGENSTPTTNEMSTKQNMYYHSTSEEESLKIHIDTIAGVKGETHTGTLLLETFFYKYDVGSLIEGFKGNFKQRSKRGKREIAALKNAYVAASRPTHLLCVAAQKSSVAGHEEDIQSAGWELVYI